MGAKGSGPRKGCQNAATHGARISKGTIARLVMGEMPKKLRRQLSSARQYRRTLEDLCVQVHGEVNATHAHLIDEAVGYEMHAALCRHLLREKPDMPVADQLRCSEQIAKARSARNKAVALLGLNVLPEPETLESYIVGKASGNGKANGSTGAKGDQP